MANIPSKSKLDRLRFNMLKGIDSVGVKESIKAPGPDQHISEMVPDEVMAVRSDRDADYTEATNGRWGTFLYKDIPKRDFDMRIFVTVTCTYGIATNNSYVYFRLRDGVAGYDQAGTVRGETRDHSQVLTYHTVTLSAFFDIPAGEDHRICCDVKMITAACTLTVVGNTNMSGADTGGCEMRIISVGRY